MGLSSSKPFQISLTDIIEKVGCYSACSVVKSLLKSRTIKNVKNILAKILTLLIEPFTMSPTAANKNYSLDVLSDNYFDTKSPVAFTSPLALYREAKKTLSFPYFLSS